MEVNTPIEAPTVSLDVAVDVNQLFATPVWSAHLGFMDRHVDAMLRDITALYKDPGPAPGYPVGDHTMPVLQDLPGDHWRDFFAALVNVAEAVSPERDERWSLKSWALRYPVPEIELRNEAQAIGQVHHHSPAMFSSVFYLQLPTSGYAPEQLGTVFRHPVPGAGDLFSPNLVTFPAYNLDLLLFPGNVDHASKKPFVGVEGPDRIVVVTDVFLTHGNDGWAPRRKVG